MSWDVSVQRFSRDYDAVDQIPDSEKCFPIGAQATVRVLISQYFPGTDWSEPSWGIFDSPNGSIEFNMGKEEPSIGFMMHVRAAPAIIEPIIAMCKALKWQALDCSSGAFLEKAAHPESSLVEWIAYRNQIVGGSDA